ncbi:MAG TPA: hypothetical protein VFA15_06540, partial [Nitrososphaera sp.]|nr:hypothetical protein [Nitrososphaera sp.]
MSSLCQSGDTALGARQFNDAIKSYDQALAAGGSGFNGPAAAKVMERKAIALRHLERLADSDRLLKQAIGYATNANTKDNDLSARLLYELADVLDQEGLANEGMSSLKQALVLMPSTQLKGTFLEAEMLNVEGRLFAYQGNAKEAENCLLTAKETVEGGGLKALSDLPPLADVCSSKEEMQGKISDSLAQLRSIQGREVESRSLAEEAGAAIKQSYGKTLLSPFDTRYSPLTLGAQSRDLSKAADKSALRAFFAQSLEEAAQLQESENLVKGSLLYYESLFKESSGDFSGALEKAKGSYGIRAKLLPAYSTDVASSLIRLSEAYLRLSRPAEAAAQAKRA